MRNFKVAHFRSWPIVNLMALQYEPGEVLRYALRPEPDEQFKEGFHSLTIHTVIVWPLAF